MIQVTYLDKIMKRIDEGNLNLKLFTELLMFLFFFLQIFIEHILMWQALYNALEDITVTRMDNNPCSKELIFK